MNEYKIPKRLLEDIDGVLNHDPSKDLSENVLNKIQGLEIEKHKKRKIGKILVIYLLVIGSVSTLLIQLIANSESIPKTNLTDPYVVLGLLTCMILYFALSLRDPSTGRLFITIKKSNP